MDPVSTFMAGMMLPLIFVNIVIKHYWLSAFCAMCMVLNMYVAAA